MKSPARLLHAAYRIGAAADGATLVPLLVPKAAAAMLGISRFAPGPDYRYATAVGTALMAGWTALLLWADREPLQRRGILLLTVCPVLMGLIAAGGYAIGSGLVRWPHLLPVFAFQVAVSALYIAAFLRARAFEHATAPADRDASASSRPLITPSVQQLPARPQP
jgi:hypothetical protein